MSQFHANYQKKSTRKMLTSLFYILVGLIALVWFFRWFERANVWMPRSEFMATPDILDLEYEDVHFTALDGVRLHGWYIPSATPRASLLFCHGNGGNISHRTESIRQFHSLNLNIFIFDYRGYGQSEGRLSEEGTYLDAQAAYRWLKQKTPDLPLISFGRSLGTAIAVELALRENPDLLFFESGFKSVPSMGKELFPFLPVDSITTINYDNLSKIPKIDIPKLFIHSPNDDIIPYTQGRAVYEAALPPKEFVDISGTHNEGYITSESNYLQAIDHFLTKYLPPSSDSDS